MDFHFFETNIFCQIFTMKLNKIMWFKNLKNINLDLLEDFFKNISPKAVTKIVLK
jgi:hypothetical protein